MLMPPGKISGPRIQGGGIANHGFGLPVEIPKMLADGILKSDSTFSRHEEAGKIRSGTRGAAA
jgi:hypothetical protein